MRRPGLHTMKTFVAIKWSDSAAGCLTEQREFEANLKKRKREFGETLERYEAEVDKYAQRSELSKRDELAAQVSELSQKLKEVGQLNHAKKAAPVQAASP